MPSRSNSSSHQAPPAIVLPEVLAVGFTGHRHIADEANCRKALYSLLAKQKNVHGRTVYAVSSVAAGGDLLFAECCMELGIQLIVLLPFPRHEFQKDFDSAAWVRAEKIMDYALSVEVTGSDDHRDERYYECGLQTVRQTQLLNTVWNGQPSRGLGGTEEIVDFARQVGRPVVWIHSETATVQHLYSKPDNERSHDSELRFLNHLSAGVVQIRQDSPSAAAHAWLAKLDANAVRVAPQVRRLAAGPIVCTALAAFVSGAASRLHPAGVWLAAGATLGIAAAVLPAALRLGKRQALWVRIRTAAEVARSVLALWETPFRYQVVGVEILPELAGMIDSLNYLKLISKPTPCDVEDFKKRYLESRLLDQKSYFLKQSKLSERKGNRYRAISKLSSIFAIVMSLWLFGGTLLLGPNGPGSSASRFLPFVSSALFQIATIAGALLIVNDCDRRQKRYKEIYTSLEKWEVELRAFRTWPMVIKVVANIERALLVELLEWRALLQNMKMPRK